MQTPYWQVDAFTDRLFAGNPAGVCLLEDWLDDPEMQAIASENNLSETAFVVRTEAGPESEPREGRRAAGAGTRFGLRWFTPTTEVDLCGHATLAAAFVLLREGLATRSPVHFETRSGELRVEQRDERLWLDLPARPARPVDEDPGLASALGAEPEALLDAGRDLMAVFGDPEAVAGLQPDFGRLADLDSPGVIATARGEDVDFVSRFFAPRMGVPEDPVTGSAHCTLGPYWAGLLGRDELRARQLSPRGGELWLEVPEGGERVLVGGQAVLYLAGVVSTA